MLEMAKQSRAQGKGETCSPPPSPILLMPARVCAETRIHTRMHTANQTDAVGEHEVNQ